MVESRMFVCTVIENNVKDVNHHMPRFQAALYWPERANSERKIAVKERTAVQQTSRWIFHGSVTSILCLIFVSSSLSPCCRRASCRMVVL